MQLKLVSVQTAEVLEDEIERGNSKQEKLGMLGFNTLRTFRIQESRER